MKNYKGITLIALIITIIVLVILAGVALNMLFGNDGIINNAQYAKEQYEKSAEKEAIAKAFSTIQIKMYMNEEENEITAELLKQQLNNAGYNVEIEVNESGNFVITFSTGDVYEVTKEGEILGEDKVEIPEEPEEEEIVDLQELYERIGLVDYWKLQGSLDNEVEGRESLVKSRGNDPDIREESTFLRNSTLSTQSNYTLNSTYTIIVQGKEWEFNSSNYDGISPLVGVGYQAWNIGAHWTGINFDARTNRYGFWGSTGSGDSYTVGIGSGNDIDFNEWHTFAITWNGSEFISYRDGEKKGSSSQSQPLVGYKLYVGGNSGDWGYTTGNYKNVLVFNRALEYYEIDAWEKLVTSNNPFDTKGDVPIYTSQQIQKIGTGKIVYYKDVKKAYIYNVGRKYVMQNDITFYGDFSPIQQLINTNQIVFDENGYTLTIVNETNPEYFTYTTTATAATITGLSDVGKAEYNKGELTKILFPTEGPNGLPITAIAANAFKGCTGFTSITIPSSVTSIGTGAFINCTSLTNITIPNGVKTIGGSAFSGCTGATGKLTIPSSVTTIGEYGFSGCTGITEIELHENLRLDDKAFSGCIGLTEISIPANVNLSDGWIFENCTNLAKVKVSSGVTQNYGDRPVFNGCTKLTQVEFAEGTTNIGNNLFNGCTNITNITIPNTVTSIGNYAFKGCTGFTSITIPSSVTSIGTGAFINCTSLTNITIPNGVKTIGGSAFSGCTGATGKLTIPSSVTTIGEYGFSGCTGITEIELHENLRLDDKAFSGCIGLTEISIPANVNLSDGWVFENCTNLVKVKVSSGVTQNCETRPVFNGCTKLTQVEFAEGITSIGNNLFNGCTNITNITIPNTLTSIGNYAFSGCTALLTATYDGNEKQFLEIVNPTGNQPLLNANITFQSEVPAGSKVTDKSGKNRTLFLMKGTSIGEDSNGKYLSFDGADDYAQIRKLDSTINWADGFTIEFKAQWNAFNNWSRILDFGNGQNSDNIVVANNARTNTLVCSTRKGSTDKSTSIATLVVGEVATYKLEYVKNGSNTYNISIKKNGEEIHADTSSVILNNIDRVTNYLGKSNWADAYFNGKIYSLKITQADGTVIVWYDLND